MMVIRAFCVLWAVSWTVHLLKEGPRHVAADSCPQDGAAALGVILGYVLFGLAPAAIVFALTLLAG